MDSIIERYLGDLKTRSEAEKADKKVKDEFIKKTLYKEKVDAHKINYNDSRVVYKAVSSKGEHYFHIPTEEYVESFGTTIRASLLNRWLF